MAVKKKRKGSSGWFGQLIGQLQTDNDDGFGLVPVVDWWCQQVPHRLHCHAWPQRLRGDILYLHAQNSTWAQEIHSCIPELKRSFQVRLRRELTEIHIRVGPLPTDTIERLRQLHQQQKV